VSAVTAPLKRTRTVAAPDRRPHLEVVGEPVRRHTFLYALLIMATLAGAIFGTVTLNALAAATAVEARELDARVATGERLYAQLVADVAALEDPARIRAAAEELGMVASGPGRLLVLERNLPADGAVSAVDSPSGAADPLKPVLSLEH
jgi:hypothetical protein